MGACARGLFPSARDLGSTELPASAAENCLPSGVRNKRMVRARCQLHWAFFLTCMHCHARAPRLTLLHVCSRASSGLKDGCPLRP
ncbi:conserved hypothetical protein [Xanthomonas phaseoli pv. phaseoli]|uniref:Uncharacterized protein n=1 Tax=Xanthomonas campestris pv. phaseoli TaxID=317013 RepID=A0A7Z7NHK6_XANCH|nr:conserved hypothetical protein [Xanthomonas phaseoli pv. phaseoli]